MGVRVRAALRLICAISILTGAAWAQLARYDGFVAPAGYNFGAANVVVCQAGGSGGPPCTPQALIYADATGKYQIPQPFQADINGRYYFYAPAGAYVTNTYGSGYTNTLTNISIGVGGPSLGTQTFGLGDTSSFVPWSIPTTSVNAPFGGAPWGWNKTVVLFQGTTNDNILAFGYNIGSNGPAVSGLPMMYDQTEIDFNDGTNHWMERHFDYTFDGVTFFRPFVYGTRLNDHTYQDMTFTIGTNATDFLGVSTYAKQLWKITSNGIWQCSTCTAGSSGQQIIQDAASSNFINFIGTQSAWQIAAGGNNVQYDFFPAATGFFNNASAPLGSSGSPWGPFFGKKINQGATNQFAGTCAMSAGTTCTATLAASFTSAPVCIATPQSSAASPPAGACLVSAGSTTVTITAAASNSLTWGYMVIGNPN